MDFLFSKISNIVKNLPIVNLHRLDSHRFSPTRLSVGKIVVLVKGLKSNFEPRATTLRVFCPGTFFTILYGIGMPRSLQIFLARLSGISECLGTVEVLRLAAFQKTECFLPSRSRSQPCSLRYYSKARRFTLMQSLTLPG